MRKRNPRRKAGEPPRERGRPRKDGSPPVPRNTRPEGAAGLCEPPYPSTLEEFRERIFHLARKGVAPIHIAALVCVDASDLEERSLEDAFTVSLERRIHEDANAFVRKAEAFGVEQVCTAFHERATDTKGHPLPAVAALNNRNDMKRNRAAEADKGAKGIQEIELTIVDEAQSEQGADGGKSQGKRAKTAAKAAPEAQAQVPEVGGAAPREGPV